MNKRFTFISTLLLITCFVHGNNLKKKTEASLDKGITYFHSLNTHEGYVYHVTPDLSLRWGEGPKDNETIEVQPPGTPAVGISFLKAFQVTGNKAYLNDAKEAAYALIQGQNKYGGWDHTINFKHLESDHVSFDDNQSQSAVRFLMALDQEMDDSTLSAATQRAINMMIETQLSNGGWHHYYPTQGNYHDYATFNDGGINDCSQVMIEAYQYYKYNEVIKTSLRKVARFLNISQLPPPQPDWAQQYNEYLQPAWARTFEPLAICTSVTIKNINSLIDIYLALHEKTILEPIPDALKYLGEIRMENGKWARFVELGTNKPLYYDRGRIRVEKLEDLHPERKKGYAYEINNRLKELAPLVQNIIDDQDTSRAWITKNDKFKKTMPKGERWNNQYEVMDRISSRVLVEMWTYCVNISN